MKTAFHLHAIPRVIKFIEAESGNMVARICEEDWNRMLLFNGYEESVWKDEEVLEMDGGDSCIMMWMHSMTLELHT